jgi:hypothetical protein
VGPLIRFEAGLAGLGIAGAIAGYLLDVAFLAFFGIVGACIAFGLLIARAFHES